jgi:hypothetical protein
MPRQNTWTNSDGLVVGFGTHSVDNGVPAEDAGNGTFKSIKLELIGTQIPLTPVVAPQSALIKRGSLIKRATLVVSEAFVGATAVINVGTYSPAGVVDDADGIDPIAIAEIGTIGAVVNCDGALVGTELTVGATSNSDVTIAFDYDTAALTAGRGILTIEYVEPDYKTAVAS